MTREELLAAGFPVSPDGYERLTAYVSLLLTENCRVNLTGAREAPSLWRAHVCDSLALLGVLGTRRPLRILDIGTGGGLPGIPLACAAADVEVTLLDATRKKIEAVERMVAGLGLAGVRAVWGRAERLAHEPEHRGKYDLVTARAVAKLSKLLAYAPALLHPHGRIWVFKSLRSLGAETRAALPVIRRQHLQPLEPVRYLLPGDTHQRVLLGYVPAR